MSTPGQGSVLGSPIIYAKVDYGPTIGFVYRPVNNRRLVTAAGNDTVQPFDQMVLYNKTAPAAFQVILPDLNLWMTKPYGGFDLIFIDSASIAATYPITFVPFGSQTIEGSAGNFVMDVDGGSTIFIPAADKSGWTLIQEAPGTAGPGGTPDPPDTSVQFNDAGSFGGQADFTFNKGTGLVSLPSLEVQTGSITTPDSVIAVANGVSFNIQAGDGGATSGNGGNVSIDGGAAPTVGAGGSIFLTGADGGLTSGDGGYAALIAGDADGGGTGGEASVLAGDASGTGVGGNLILRAGEGDDIGRGGNVDLFAGTGGGTSGNGGFIDLRSGNADGIGDSGHINIIVGDANGTGNGGPLELDAGGASNGNGGDVTIDGGDGGTNGDGGDIILTAGFKAGAGTDGDIFLKPATSGFIKLVNESNGQLSTLIRQNSKSAVYTTILTDSGKHILHPTADNNPRTFTIDSNANVPYLIGTAITFVNEINTVTIAITSDTLTLAGTGTTGSRTLAANGVATALKIGTTKWIISGTGIT